MMAGVVYRGRALPLVWLTHKGKKGHFPQALHVELIKAVQAIVPAGREVVVLGDGEFDGTGWLAAIESRGWRYVCRTAKDSVFYEGEDDFKIQDICPGRGGCTGIPGVRFTTGRYGPVMAVAWWGKGYLAPIYLVSTIRCPKRRACITGNVSASGRCFPILKAGGSSCKRAAYAHPNGFRAC